MITSKNKYQFKKISAGRMIGMAVLSITILLSFTGCSASGKAQEQEAPAASAEKNEADSTALSIFAFEKDKTVIQTLIEILGDEYDKKSIAGERETYTWENCKLYDDFYGEFQVVADDGLIVSTGWKLGSYTEARGKELYEMLKKDSNQYKDKKSGYVMWMIMDIDGKGVEVLWRCFDKEEDCSLAIGSTGAVYDEAVTVLDENAGE